MKWISVSLLFRSIIKNNCSVGGCNVWMIWVITGLPHQRTINTLKPRRNEHFADDVFKRIFFNENVWILIKISLKVVPKGPIDNIPALVQIMACRRSGDKPLSEPMMVSLPRHICVTRPQWLTHWSQDKTGVISPRKFSEAFFEWKLLYSDLTVTEVCSWRSSWK